MLDTVHTVLPWLSTFSTPPKGLKRARKEEGKKVEVEVEVEVDVKHQGGVCGVNGLLLWPLPGYNITYALSISSELTTG